MTVTGGLVALVYGVIDGVQVEFRRARRRRCSSPSRSSRAAPRNPLVPFAIFRSRSLTGATVTGVLMGGALIGLFFFATLYLQQVLHYGPLKAGLAFLPLALTIGASAGLASQLSTKFGPKPVLVAGLAVQAAGLYWFSHVSADGSFLGDVLFPSLVVALGMGLAFVPLTIAAMSGVTEDESGLASGLMATAQQIGQAVGLAILTGVATTTAATRAGADRRLRGRVPRRRGLRADRRPGGLHDHRQDPRRAQPGHRGSAVPGLGDVPLGSRGDGADRGTGAAPQLQGQADEGELADAVGRELLEDRATR